MKTARIYGIWITALAVLMAVGIGCYLRQLSGGLGLTGMSRDVSWGLYIGQFLFAEGIAASSAILFFRDGRAFRKIALFGVLIAIAGVIASMLFIVADMGKPSRVLNVLRYASPGSLMFWDMLSLGGYLALNILIGAVLLDCERKDVPMPRWLRPVIRLSVPWAIGMLTIGAFLYCGLPGRSFWLTTILAPRFIASAFASGPALLILVLLCLGGEMDEALRKLARVVRYAMALNLGFILLEIFTTFYARIPEPMQHFRYLFAQPWMWASMILGVASLMLLRRNLTVGPLAYARGSATTSEPRPLEAVKKSTRRPKACSGNSCSMVAACVAALVSLWLDKGFGMVIGGFVPSPNGAVTEYFPTVPEIAIAAGIWAIGAFIATLLIRTAIELRADSGRNSELLLLEQEVYL